MAPPAPAPVPPTLKVALPVPVDAAFDYLPADDTPPPGPGCRVLVPLGRRTVVGVVTAHGAADGPPATTLKPIVRVLDPAPLFTPESLATITWAAGYYLFPLGMAFAAALPARLRSARELPEPGVPVLALTAAGRDVLAEPAGKRATRTRALLERLATGPLDPESLDVALPGWRAAARQRASRGLVERRRGPVPRQPTTHGPSLNDEQRSAVTAIVAAHDGFASFLLDGVTGSGKTEVYLDAIVDCLARDRQALVLVPEIALTPQAHARFRRRLGVDIALLHSGLAETERARHWLAAARGDAPVVLGTRSAVFVPLPRAGLIVVDEEHDTSYKQQEGFTYNARDLALVRARTLGVPVVLGSATPSLESLANAAAGRYRPLRLAHRAGAARPPRLTVVDLRRQRLDGRLAPPTLDAIAAVARGEQALVFRNRRGYAPVLFCHDCGWSARCAECERAMTVHDAGRMLRCHHCGAQRPAPKACPECRGLALHAQGFGTERIESVLARRFPGVPLRRIDRDTTRGPRARSALLDDLPEAGARILIGTQMLAKGHDLPHLTLAVIAGVDEGLRSADFRAPERLGQLIVQVAGRAGRAEKPGEVLLQTHEPDHPLLGTLLREGYRAYTQRLLDERRAASLPPFTHFALLRAEATDEATLGDFLATAATPAAPGVTVHPPLPAPVPKRGGRLRGQVLVESASRTALHAFLPELHRALAASPPARRIHWSIDVDPVDFG
ncbi:MAG: primosomal protein N' [Lysobacterales bacterium]